MNEQADGLRETLPRFADIAVDAPGKDSYTYRIPDDFIATLQIGDAVEVPYGSRRLRGFVLQVHNNEPQDFTCKQILSRRDDLQLPANLMRLVAWGAQYYHSHLGEFLAAAVPAPVRQGVQLQPSRMVIPNANHTSTLTVKQQSTFALLPETGLLFPELCRLAGCSASVVEALDKKGAVRIVADKRIQEQTLEHHEARHALTAEQDVAVAAVQEAIDANKQQNFLLYGVTGSGKTLVYMELAERLIHDGKQVLLLLPEIGLTPQLAARFRRRFERVAIWHSAFSDGERSEQWQRVARGDIDLVIGTRSALFAPLYRCGLIIVDEEHDSSFKQDSDPRYHGRDMAVVYAKQLGVPVILGSATPSLESYDNARSGKYTALTLRQRPAGGSLPEPLIVDMASENQRQGRQAIISQALVERLQEGRERGEQAIILLNRRGWSPLVECPSCGWVAGCHNCDISLTLHRSQQALRCHYCGHQEPMPQECPACGNPGLSSKGLGTEQLEHQLRSAVPGLTTLRLDADTVNKKNGHAHLLKAFADGGVDCLVGTQMVAKGLDFPSVTTVGIIQADRGLAMPDFRASERTFQLIAQVAGRAGRGERPGSVIVQAYDTEAAAITCALALRVKTFYQRELDLRQQYGYPPHGGLLRLLWTGPDLGKVSRQAEAVCAQITPLLEGAVILGPTPAGIAVIKNQCRWHAIIKAGSRGAIQQFLHRISGVSLAANGVRCAVDVDPYSIT